MKAKTPKIYKFYGDPSHGWLAVKMQEIIDLGISQKISSFSYMHGQTVYLEEDCDAPIFVKAMQEKNPEFVLVCNTKHTDKTSPIRSYSRYTLGDWFSW